MTSRTRSRFDKGVSLPESNDLRAVPEKGYEYYRLTEEVMYGDMLSETEEVFYSLGLAHILINIILVCCSVPDGVGHAGRHHYRCRRRNRRRW